jgi:hypothetical protein
MSKVPQIPLSFPRKRESSNHDFLGKVRPRFSDDRREYWIARFRGR